MADGWCRIDPMNASKAAAQRQPAVNCQVGMEFGPKFWCHAKSYVRR